MKKAEKNNKNKMMIMVMVITWEIYYAKRCKSVDRQEIKKKKNQMNMCDKND